MDSYYTSLPNIPQMAYSQHYYDNHQFTHGVDLGFNQNNQSSAIIQPAPFTQSIPYPSSHSQFQQTLHHSHQPTGPIYYPKGSTPHLQAEVGANLHQGSQSMYWSPGPGQESLSQLQRPSASIAGRGGSLSSGRGGHGNSSLRARGCGRGPGPTRAQPTISSTTTTSTKPPLTMKQILDQFLPKSIVTMLPDSAKTFTPNVAYEFEEIMKKVAAQEISAAEVRVVAAKNCKKSFSQSNGSFFMAL